MYHPSPQKQRFYYLLHAILSYATIEKTTGCRGRWLNSRCMPQLHSTGITTDDAWPSLTAIGFQPLVWVVHCLSCGSVYCKIVFLFGYLVAAGRVLGWLFAGSIVCCPGLAGGMFKCVCQLFVWLVALLFVCWLFGWLITGSFVWSVRLAIGGAYQ